MVEAIRQGDIPGVQLRCRRRLPAPAPTVWRWLTEGPRLDAWAGRARLPGGPGDGIDAGIELALEEGGEALRERGRTLELIAGERWVLAFERLDDGWEAATRLTFELTPDGDGCELSVLQQGFEHLPLSRCLTIWETYRRRWRRALERLAAALAGAPPSGDTSG